MLLTIDVMVSFKDSANEGGEPLEKNVCSANWGFISHTYQLGLIYCLCWSSLLPPCSLSVCMLS